MFGFGGGYAMLSLIQYEVVDHHHWLTLQQFTDVVAISQMTPGPIGINSATYVGYAVTQSVWGAVVTTIAVCLPSFILVLLISYFFVKCKDNKYIIKRIRRSNKAYFAAGMEAGKQKVTDLFFVAAHELGMLKSPAKAKELLDKMEQLDAEYGVAWLGKKESDDAIHRLDSSLKKLCGPFFQPFFERNDTIKDWWDK